MAQRVDAPGFYHMKPEDYFADPCPEPSLTQSGIGTLTKTAARRFAYEHPRLTWATEEEKQKGLEDRANRHRGDVCHRLALGRGKEYRILDFRDYKTKDAQAAKQLCLVDGFTPVLAHKMPEYEAMAAEARAAFETILKGQKYETEVVAIWKEIVNVDGQEVEIWCRAMLDVYCAKLGMALDPKFTDLEATEEVFARQANAIGYAIQNRWYSRGIAALNPDLAGRVKFRHMLIESAPPHCWQHFGLRGKYRDLADSKIEVGRDRFARGMLEKVWPNYPPEGADVDPPSWAFTSWFNAETGETERVQ